MSEESTCRVCGAILSRYRCPEEPEGLCALHSGREGSWRVLDPEALVLAVAGILACAAAERPGEKVHLQTDLEARGILADHLDVHLAVEKLRRRYSWRVEAEEGRPGYRLDEWPFRFRRRRSVDRSLLEQA